MLALMPCAMATRATEIADCSHSVRICAFSSRLYRRLRFRLVSVQPPHIDLRDALVTIPRAALGRPVRGPRMSVQGRQRPVAASGSSRWPVLVVESLTRLRAPSPPNVKF